MAGLNSLERILQGQGFGSRKVCRALVRDGRVKIDGSTCENPYAEFEPEGLELEVDGEIWPYHEKAYLMLNKPPGYECSRSPSHHTGVLDLLPEPLRQRGIQPVGRLDEDTTGLLLLTDDGQFIHRLISPKRKVAKVYEVETKHPVTDEQITALLAGVQLHDEPEPIAAAACERLSERVIQLTITEGKYHQVKRMLAAAGNRVDCLKRVAIGGLKLPDYLPERGWRWLEPTDLEKI